MQRKFFAGSVLVTVIAAASAFVAFGNENEEVGCTLAGCKSGVKVLAKHLPPGVATVALCRDDVCIKERVQGKGDTYTVACKPEPATVYVEFTIRDARGKVVDLEGESVELERNEPNGPDCGPTCWQAGLVYNGRTARLTSLPNLYDQ